MIKDILVALRHCLDRILILLIRRSAGRVLRAILPFSLHDTDIVAAYQLTPLDVIGSDRKFVRAERCLLVEKQFGGLFRHSGELFGASVLNQSQLRIVESGE